MKAKFWPLDFDAEGEVYDLPTWDMPGRERLHKQHRKPKRPTDRKVR